MKIPGARRLRRFSTQQVLSTGSGVNAALRGFSLATCRHAWRIAFSLGRLLLGLLLSATCLQAATNALVAPVPVPSSPYLPRIYKYADALLDDAASRTNLHKHQNWLRVLYTLTDLSTKAKYRDAADSALRVWLANVPSAGERIERPWMLWDRCFQIDRAASERFAIAVVKNQITNHPGFYLRTCAAGYAHTTNAAFLKAIETFVSGVKGPVPVSVAIDCDGVARLLPEPLAAKLRALAADQLTALSRDAATGMMHVSRYENTGRTAFREAVHSAANESLKSPTELPPITLGHSISLQLAAWRSTARQDHLDKARAFADFALTNYFDGPPQLVPGLDTLALSLVELHLHILYITAVRYPPNTLDR